MHARLRTDLDRILPRPVSRPTGGVNRFEGAVSAPVRGDRPDYLLDVQRSRRVAPDAPGFAIRQAQAAAERIAQVLGHAPLRPGLFALDRDRTRRLLD